MTISRRTIRFSAFATALASAAVLALAASRAGAAPLSRGASGYTLATTTQFVGFKSTTSGKGNRLTGAIASTASRSAGQPKSGTTMTVGPAGLATVAAPPQTAHAEGWTVYY